MIPISMKTLIEGQVWTQTAIARRANSFCLNVFALAGKQNVVINSNNCLGEGGRGTSILLSRGCRCDSLPYHIQPQNILFSQLKDSMKE